MRRVVIAHGGTGSTPKEKDGAEQAAEAGMKALREEGPLEAVVAACTVLEDDERFNAGSGSLPRFDGKTIEMDSAVMDSRKKYGAVSGIERVKHPVLVARRLMDLPDNIVAGKGATALARAMGMKDHDPMTKTARRKWEETIAKIRKGEDSSSDNEWDLEELRSLWNYETPFEEIFGTTLPPAGKKAGRRLGHSSDTIGAVATDGRTFAAAGSTGGTLATLRGRVGDTPILGAGIFAADVGAVVCTGNGDHLVRERAATLVHDWLADGFTAQAAVRRLSARFADETDMWAAVIGLEDHACGGNREIAFGIAEE